ncbi:hypothetical protein BGX34_011911 [Mortierella sp. NVP85]|nr:hypothetical protein BGX34_011911 [Mortierella sp. NVP85]
MSLPHRWGVFRTGLKTDYGVTILLGPYAVLSIPDVPDEIPPTLSELTLSGEIGGFCKRPYPNLRRLELDMTGVVDQNHRLFTDLIMKTPVLVNLKLVAVDTPSTFWDVLSTLTHIRRLDLASMSLKAKDSAGLWGTCKKLESLLLKKVVMEEAGRPEDVVFDRLRTLGLETTNLLNGSLLEGTYQMDLILQSPILESLELKIGTYGDIQVPTANLDDWPHFKKIYIDGGNGDSNLDSIYKRDGSGVGDTVDIELYCSELHTPASMKFGSHFSTLVDVDLLRSETICYSILPDILCLCPRLEKLQSAAVLARHVAERGPWVCQQLRELRIQFLFDASTQDLREPIFERLSALVWLEQLTLDYGRPRRGNGYEGLECRLDCGLGRLASLQQLTSVWLNTPINKWGINWGSPSLGMEEAEWILENWEKLERIKGNLSYDPKLMAQLTKVLRSRGITVELR